MTGGKERIRYFIEDFGGQGAPTDGLDAFIRELHATKTDAYVDIVSGGELELRPGVRELIHAARMMGYRLAIATTTTPANIDALFSATFPDAGADLFEVICAGDSVPNKKPAPDVYLKALEELGLPAASCVAIEDSRNGLLSAIAAGIPTIVAPGIYTIGEDFGEAVRIVDDLSAIDFNDVETVFA